MEQTQQDLMVVQQQLEEEGLSLGIERYRKALEHGEDSMPPGMKLMTAAIQPLSAAIGKHIEETLAGKASRSAGVIHYLESFDTDALAFITAKTCFHHLNTNSLVQRVAISVVDALEDSVNYDELKKVDPRAHRRLMERIKESTDANYKQVLLRRQQAYVGIKAIKWSHEVKLRIGITLIHLMEASTGLVQIQRFSRGKNDTPQFLMPTQSTKDYLDKSHARCELLSPVYMPMVVPPREWRSPFHGGYITPKMRYPLIKTANRNYLEELRHHDMPMVYAGVNAMQKTPWAINKGILRVMKEVWDGGGRLGKLPPKEDYPLPPKTFDEANPDPEVLKKWKQAASKVYTENARLVSKRVQMQSKLHLAEKFSHFERFYFPHALDWRGRAYPVASFLNPQGDDAAKALLTFADGKPLGVNGAYWLAVHGANTFGVDKVSFDERFDWVQAHHAEIIESAMNPLDGSRFWATAGSPYMFLAFCMEWLALDLHTAAGNPEDDYVSYLPVSWDGACNGLQNFSAMLRDEVGGKAVGLVPSDTPSDIYSEVARQAQLLIDADAADVTSEYHAVAQRWVGKMTRKLAKRNTMTVPYGVSQFGMKEQLVEEFRKIKEEAAETGEVIDYEMDLYDASYVAGKNYEAIGKVVIAARKAMDWLQAAAKVAAKDGLPIRWNTPSGLMVLQDYRKLTGVRADFMVQGKRYQLLLQKESDALDTRKQSTGISPNFVHSLDAAHMVRTVGYGVEAGITHYAMVHDSFGTHAGDADKLNWVLRKAFVDQYSGDVLRSFRDQLVEQLPPELAEKIPPLPAMGTLELEGVMHSEYFFA